MHSSAQDFLWKALNLHVAQLWVPDALKQKFQSSSVHWVITMLFSNYAYSLPGGVVHIETIIWQQSFQKWLYDGKKHEGTCDPCSRK